MTRNLISRGLNLISGCPVYCRATVTCTERDLPGKTRSGAASRAPPGRAAAGTVTVAAGGPLPTGSESPAWPAAPGPAVNRLEAWGLGRKP